MDHESFDRIVRVLGTAGSRRAALASLLGAGSLGIVGEALGKGKGKDRKKQRDSKRSHGKGKDKGENGNRQRGKDRAGKQPPAAANEPPAGDAVSAEAADCFSLQSGSNFNRCNFNDQDLSGLILHSSSMRETKFRGADLCETDLSSSQLKDADFRGLAAANRTNLTRADLSSSGCAGTRFDANTVFCATKTCGGAVNNRDCPANGPICCDTADCPERVCKTGVCQSPGCVYTDQPDGQPGTLCEAPLECCDGDCTDTTTDPINCGACGEDCGPGKGCEDGECVCTCAQDACLLFAWGQLGAGDGDLDEPRGLAVAPNGNVYVADTDNSRIQRFSATGEFRGAWGSLGGADGEFRSAVDVAVAPNGNVYVVDFGNDRIQVFSPTGTFLFTWGQEGDADGEFGSPSGVAVAPNGDVYVAEFGLGIRNTARVQRFSASGQFLGKWGQQGSNDGEFRGPNGVAVAPSGDVYVVEQDNRRVQRFSATGQFLGKWGQQGDGDGEFETPQGIAVAANGDVYVADAANWRIQRFSPTGTFLGTWGQLGDGDDDFGFPTRVAAAPHGDIYVSDTGAHRIKAFCVNPG